jgi:hypothetical protein
MKKICIQNTILWLVSLLALTLSNVQAQTDYGKEPQKAKEALMRATDEMKVKKYDLAKPDVYWLMQNAPKISKNIYIWGVAIYGTELNNVKDEARKRVLQDSIMTICDLRIANIGEEAKILDEIKGNYAFGFYIKDKDKLVMLHDLYEKIYKLKGDDLQPYNAEYLLQVTGEAKNANLKGLNDDSFLQTYEKLMKTVEVNIAKNDAKKAKWEELKAKLPALFELYVKVDCEFVKKQYIPKYRANPKDTLLIRKIQSLMSKDENCKKDPFLLEINTNFAKDYPSYNNWYRVAYYHILTNNGAAYNEAMNEAFKYGGTDQEKAEHIYRQADNKRRAGAFAEARTLYNQAAAMDKSLAGKAYSSIGDMYMQSGTMCVGDGKNTCLKKAVYIAAYNMYAKAGNNVGMQRAAAYFPNNTDLFTWNMSGKTVNTGCWVGENVTMPTVK